MMTHGHIEGVRMNIMAHGHVDGVENDDGAWTRRKFEE